jgi:hypothetical protein
MSNTGLKSFWKTYDLYYELATDLTMFNPN